MKKLRHFLTLNDLTRDEIYQLLNRADELKKLRDNQQKTDTLSGKTLAMIFEKSSTRTRVSFEAGINQLGGNALFITPQDSQIGRGEPIADTAKVISSMVDIVMLRTHKHSTITEFAAHSKVPVINGLSETNHPCQLLADLLTIQQHKKTIEGLTIAWIGDGNNMCNSYINAALLLDIQLRIHTPIGYELQNIPKSSTITFYSSPKECSRNADIITTDVCTSMGQEKENKQRLIDFKNCQVNEQVMKAAKDDALFLHCLPAHREEEVTTQVIDGSQSLVWKQAENRLHAQKALMEMLINQST